MKKRIYFIFGLIALLFIGCVIYGNIFIVPYLPDSPKIKPTMKLVIPPITEKIESESEGIKLVAEAITQGNQYGITKNDLKMK